MKKVLIFVLVLVLLLSVSSCRGKKDVKKALEEIRTGTEGISVSFLPNNPPEKIHIEKGKGNEFDLVVEVKNRGAYPQPADVDQGVKVEGKVYLSGYDTIIVKIPTANVDLKEKTQALIGKSLIDIYGGSELFTFKGSVDFDKLNVEKYEPILLATICYKYFTEAGPSVCINPYPYSTDTRKNVCEVQDISLSNQGAPIAVISIDEEAFAEKTQFKITVKNVGGGDVLKSDAINKCDPFGTQKLGRDDIDKVKLESVKIGDTSLECSPFAEGEIKGSAGIIRLINGEGHIICDLIKSKNDAYQKSQDSYTTPLKIILSYGYRTNAERKLQIKKEPSRV